MESRINTGEVQLVDSSLKPTRIPCTRGRVAAHLYFAPRAIPYPCLLAPRDPFASVAAIFFCGKWISGTEFAEMTMRAAEREMIRQRWAASKGLQ